MTPPSEVKTLSGQRPDKIEVFRIGRWRMDHLDQEMMRTMRKIADKRGATIEEVMDRALVDFIARCVADSELATKIIQFPIKRPPKAKYFSGNRQPGRFSARPHAIKRGGLNDPLSVAIEKSKRVDLTRGIKALM